MKKSPFNDIRESAESGDVFSQVMFGFLVEHGLKMAPDKGAAEAWYRRADEQGFAPGTHGLAMLVADKDPAEGIRYFRKAAGSGYAPAQLALGCIYQDGDLTAPEDAIAVKWVKAAADQEYTPAILHLAIMYAEGISVEPDPVQSMYYLRKAVEKGSPAAAFQLGHALVEEGEKAKLEEGLKWIWQAALKSEPFANFFLAEMYGEGLYGAVKDKRLHDFFLSKSKLKEQDVY